MFVHSYASDLSFLVAKVNRALNIHDVPFVAYYLFFFCCFLGLVFALTRYSSVHRSFPHVSVGVVFSPLSLSIISSLCFFLILALYLHILSRASYNCLFCEAMGKAKNYEKMFWVIILFVGGGGALSLMVIVVGNGHGDTSSNPGRDGLHFT